MISIFVSTELCVDGACAGCECTDDGWLGEQNGNGLMDRWIDG